MNLAIIYDTTELQKVNSHGIEVSWVQDQVEGSV